MPGIHKNPTISFRANEWERTLIETRAAMSGLHKKDFIIRSCIYSRIVVVGMEENIRKIVDALQAMQIVLKDIERQFLMGTVFFSENEFKNMERRYLALIITVMEIINGAAYLFADDSGNSFGEKREEK